MAEPDVSAASILGEPGLRYKRNNLAASLIATVLYWTDAPLGDVSLFGVSLANVQDKEATAWLIFFVILCYQWIMLAYYGWVDWRVWQLRIRENFKFSPLNIAFWMKEGAVMWGAGTPTTSVLKEVDRHPNYFIWRALPPEEVQNPTKGHIFYSDRENIRWRLGAFLTIEFGLPFCWGLACLYLAVSKILECTISAA